MRRYTCRKHMHKDNFKPMVSIIVPVFNEADKTVRCFTSIKSNTNIPFEVIWVDNGSNPANFPIIKKSATKPGMHTKLVKFNRNVGFVKAINAGLKEIEDSSQYIIFLNNDTEVGIGWAKKLVTTLSDKKVGAVGPITQSKISWQEAENLNRLFKTKLPRFPIVRTRTPDSKIITGYAKQLDKYSGQVLDCGTIPLSFFCVALRRDVIESIGGLDEDFGFGLGDDDEYCHRLRTRGYSLAVRLDAFVYHHHRTTFKSLKLPVDTIRRKNVKLLKEKKKINEEKANEDLDIDRKKELAGISKRIPCIP